MGAPPARQSQALLLFAPSLLCSFLVASTLLSRLASIILNSSAQEGNGSASRCLHAAEDERINVTAKLGVRLAL